MIDVNPIIGKPYKLGGRGPDVFDCWGVVLWVYRQLGISLPDAWCSDTSKAEQLRTFRRGAAPLRIPFDEVFSPNTYDLVMDAHKGHIGVMLGNRVLHATQTHGVSIVPLIAFDSFYPNRTLHRCQM